MCTVSFVIEGWRHPTWPALPAWPAIVPITSPVPVPIPHTSPPPEGQNPIPWPLIQQDPKLAQQMLEILSKLEKLDRRMGALEKCKVSKRAKKNLKDRLRRIARKVQR